MDVLDYFLSIPNIVSITITSAVVGLIAFAVILLWVFKTFR